MARTAEVKRDARIGEAEASKDSQIKEAIAEEERMAAKYSNDTEIAKAQRDFELKKASYDMEVQAKASVWLTFSVLICVCLVVSLSFGVFTLEVVFKASVGAPAV